MNARKKIFSLIGCMLLLFVLVGVTYAVFQYTKEGTAENAITTGTLKFLYTENTGVGSGIHISNALPVSDDIGKSHSTEDYVFDFKIEATNSGLKTIPYEVTLRKNKNSTLDEKNIKVYLTDMTDNADRGLLAPTKYSELSRTTIDVGENIEKTIYQGVVSGKEKDYLKNFRLRMWISGDSDQSEVNEKTFTATVNVYATINVVNEPTDPTMMNKNNHLKVGDAVTTVDGSKWHVLEESVSGIEMVTILSDYNIVKTTADYTTTCIENNYKQCVIEFDPNKTIDYDEQDSNNIGYFIKYVYAPKVISAISGTIDVTIPTAEQIAKADGKVFAQADLPLNKSWLTTTNYWTKTPNPVRKAVWCVFGHQALINDDYPYNDGGMYCGVRPIITTPKTNIFAESK